MGSSMTQCVDGAIDPTIFNDPGNIYVMDADGSNRTKLTASSYYGDFQPDWSPDGTQITFSSKRDGNYEIYVMNADGANQTRLTSNSGGRRRSYLVP